jgi:hypothetical protein
MKPSLTMRKAQDAARRFLDDELGFQRVPLLLIGMIAPLFFFGRSMGVPVMSISTTSNTRSFAAKDLRPGKRTGFVAGNTASVCR